MKLLLCVIGLSVLLSYGVVEAGAKDADCFHTGSDGTVYNICNLPDLSEVLGILPDYIVEGYSNLVVVCNEDNTKCETPCEKKMREAMKAVDHLFHIKLALLADESIKDQIARPAMKLWDAVMQECVRP